MANINKLLGSLLSSGAATGFAGGLAGGMASKMIKKKNVKKLGKGALQLGGVAAVGALAYTAYKRYKNPQSPAPVAAQAAAPIKQPIDLTGLFDTPEAAAFLPSPDDQAATNELSLTLIRAMIAAARSDGRLDAQESQAIFQKIEEMGLDNESQDLLVQEMGHPVDIDAIVNSASSPEVAAEIYVASFMAVDVDTPAEKSYLGMLASRLKLPPKLVMELENQVNAQ